MTSACAGTAPPPVTVTVTAPPSEAAPTTTATTTRPREESIVGSGYAVVCQGRGFADAAAYTGRGPHPIGISVDSKDRVPSGLNADLEVKVATLPAKWAAKANTELQLVACVTVIDVREVRECQYRTIGSTTGAFMFTSRLFHRVLRVEVRATRTGKPVAAAVQVTTGVAVCAGSVKPPPRGSEQGPNQFGTLTDAQRDKLLGGFVTATV